MSKLLSRRKTVGVLGGLGPLATVYYMQSVIDLTEADSDQEHVDMIVTQRSSTPDRTAAILDGGESPAPVMAQDAQRLETAGADFIVIPCNTATNFTDAVHDVVTIPIVNIVEETVHELARRGICQGSNVAIMATNGTITSGIYQDALSDHGFTPLIPESAVQQTITSIIYDYVKAGKTTPADTFFGVINALKNVGASAVITGCTELSVVYKDLKISDPTVVDSLDVLVRKTIVEAGHSIRTDSAKSLHNR